MRTFDCTCGNRLFFNNSLCMSCKHEVGWCPNCEAIHDVTPTDGGFICSGCSSMLVKCENYANHNVCNRFVLCDNQKGSQGATSAGVLCGCCRYNRTIPDLKIKGNQEKWFRLELAKRRVFYGLDMLGFPYGNEKDGVKPPLAFEFKGELIQNHYYRGMDGSGQKVFTGHDNGVITINIQEADDVAREKLRVDMGEAHRSLLGHFRHEFGHYVWDVLIKGSCEDDCAAVFGDHRNPAYDQALADYYKNGPKPNWINSYISAYSTMHPWEDFAETFAEYLDMVSALDTAFHGGLIPNAPDLTRLDPMVDAYLELGLSLNEMNRSNGLLDYMPEVIAPPVREKMRYIHKLARPGAKHKTPRPADQCQPVGAG